MSESSVFVVSSLTILSLASVGFFSLQPPLHGKVSDIRFMIPSQCVLTVLFHLVIAPDMYEMSEVGAGLRMPSVNFVANIQRYNRGALSVLILFYFGLWAIKLNFLVFFYRLGSQVTYYRIAWWAVTIFTMAAFLQCVGTIQYSCMSNTFEYITANCTGEAAVRWQDITLKFNCAVDVLTDALSKITTHHDCLDSNYAVMMLPISILWNVRISFLRRLALAGVFSLVVITMIVSIVRVTVVAEKAASNRKGKQVEITWLFMWHFIESSVGRSGRGTLSSLH
jgi:hypothetical protein